VYQGVVQPQRERERERKITAVQSAGGMRQGSFNYFRRQIQHCSTHKQSHRGTQKTYTGAYLALIFRGRIRDDIHEADGVADAVLRRHGLQD
jgi:hypothetical protein